MKLNRIYNNSVDDGHWEKHTSWAGNTYWLWEKYKSMPKIPQPLTKCVFYVYPSKDDALNNSEYGGTGFFFGIPSKVWGEWYLYAVTNSHVIFQTGMETPVIRVNVDGGGFDIIETQQINWDRHPDAHDIAVCHIQFDTNKIDGMFFTKEAIVDEKFLKEYSVGPGDDIFMVGRFRVHAGRKRNLPVVRFGNIAAMNDEPLYNKFLKLTQESYLVEMRSIAGFSGSPVLIYINPFASPRFDNLPIPVLENSNQMIVDIQYKLLGIQWGQISYKVRANDENDNEYKMEIDSAMEGVVPIQKLVDFLYDSKMEEKRRKFDESKINQLKQQRDDESSVSLT